MSGPTPDCEPAPVPGAPRGRGAWAPALLFPVLALILLWPALGGGKVLLPAAHLRAFSPWDAGLTAEDRRELPQWNILQWDGMAEFYPWRLHLARSLSAGRIPLWNPHVLCGTPFLANSQSAPLYPPHALFALPGASTTAVMAWLAFLHLSLAGLFAWLLARDLGARPGAALLGGAAFQLSGFAVAWLELPSFIAVTCWMPLAVLCVSRAVRFNSVRWAAGAAAALGMMLLAGHLQVAFYGLLAAGAAWVYEAIVAWSRRRRSVDAPLPFPDASLPLSAARRRRALAGRVLAAALLGAGALAVAMALASPQLLPTIELSRVSHRAGAPTEAGYAGYLRLAMGARNWITLLVPDYYGLPARGDFWGFWSYGPPNVMEYAGHVGMAAFVLAAAGLAWGRRVNGRALLWAGIALAALLLAAGSPLNRLFYFHVPGFAQSGSPARALVLFCLAQAVLAALGMEWLLRRAEQGFRPLAADLAACGGAALLLLFSLHALAGMSMEGVPPDLADSGTREVSIPALFRALLYAGGTALAVLLMAWLFRENSAAQRQAAVGAGALAVLAAGLLWLGADYNPTSPPALAYPETPLTRQLRAAGARVATVNRDWPLWETPRALLPPNASLAYGWRDAQGYDSLYLRGYRMLANALDPSGASPESNGNVVFVKNPASPLLPLLAAKYVVSREPLAHEGMVPASGFPPGPPHVFENRHAVPEAYVAASWAREPDHEGLARLQRLGPAGLARTASVGAGQPVPDWRPEALGPQPPRPARLLRRTPERLTVESDPELPGLLVLVEGFAPGWKARIHPRGAQPRPAPVLRVNAGFQGIFVGSGPLRAEWSYEPASFRVGLFLALCAILVLGAVAVPAAGRRGKNGRAR